MEEVFKFESSREAERFQNFYYNIVFKDNEVTGIEWTGNEIKVILKKPIKHYMVRRNKKEDCSSIHSRM